MYKKFRVIVFILVCQLSGIVGTLFTRSQIESWYLGQLVRPSFAPPNWIFGPVWTLLYTLMGIAWYLVYQGKGDIVRTRALWAFGIQLILNALWTPVFFGAHALFFSVIIILAMWMTIVITMYFFYRIHRVAAYLLIPYLLWVSFASVLNIAIWVLN